jgi:hypothetical protein
VRLPGYLPQLVGNLWTPVPESDETVVGEPGLLTTLSNCLHLFAIEFERDFPVGLAVAANVLRVLDSGGVHLPDIQQAAGISAVAGRWSLRVLESEWLSNVPTRTPPRQGRAPEPEGGQTARPVLRPGPRGRGCVDAPALRRCRYRPISVG